MYLLETHNSSHAFWLQSLLIGDNGELIVKSYLVTENIHPKKKRAKRNVDDDGPVTKRVKKSVDAGGGVGGPA